MPKNRPWLFGLPPNTNNRPWLRGLPPRLPEQIRPKVSGITQREAPITVPAEARKPIDGELPKIDLEKLDEFLNRFIGKKQPKDLTEGRRLFETDALESAKRVIANLAVGMPKIPIMMGAQFYNDPIEALKGMIRFLPELGGRIRTAIGTGTKFDPEFDPRVPSGKIFKPYTKEEVERAREELFYSPEDVALLGLPFLKGLTKARLKAPELPKAKPVAPPLLVGEKGKVVAKKDVVKPKSEPVVVQYDILDKVINKKGILNKKAKPYPIFKYESGRDVVTDIMFQEYKLKGIKKPFKEWYKTAERQLLNQIIIKNDASIVKLPSGKEIVFHKGRYSDGTILKATTKPTATKPVVKQPSKNMVNYVLDNERIVYPSPAKLASARRKYLKQPTLKGVPPERLKAYQEAIKEGMAKREQQITKRYAGLAPEVFAKKKSPIRVEAEERFLNITRERKARIYGAHDKARKWEKQYSELERENAGAIVENIENLRTGEKPVVTSQVKKLVGEYKVAQETARRDINKYLENTGTKEYISFLNDYLPHFYTGKIKQATSKWLTKSPNAKRRLLPTLKEAVDLGLKPISQDVAFLHKTWADVNWQVAANRQTVFMFKNLKLPDGKKAVRAGDQPAPDWIHFDHPAIAKVYARKTKDGKLHLWRGGVWVHPDIVPVARMAFQNPLKNRTFVGRTYDTTGAFAKTGELAFSGFHFGALLESGQAVLAKAKNPIRGFLLFGKEARTIAGRPIEFTFRAGKKIQAKHPELVMDFIRDGLEFGAAKKDIGFGTVQRNLRNLESRTSKIPVLGWFTRKFRQSLDLINKGLWEQIHEGFKVYSHYSILKQELPKLPVDATFGQTKRVRESVARSLNDAFGGQEWEAKFWLSPKGLLYSRRAFLAPDWTLSNLSIFGRTMFEYKNPVVKRMAIKYWRNMALTIFGVTQGLNYWSSGKFTWDNEIGHKLDIDVTKVRRRIDAIIGRKPKNPNQRYYIRIAKQAREVLSWFQNPLKIAGNKMNPIAKEIFKQATGADPGSGFPAEWTKEELEFYESIPKRIKSIANKFTPFSLRGNNFAFSLPMSKGMTPYKAIKFYQKALDGKDWFVFGKHTTKTNAIREITKAAIDNGLNSKQLYISAMAAVRTKYYTEYFEALEEQDWDKVNKVAEILKELGVTAKNIRKSAETRGIIK